VFVHHVEMNEFWLWCGFKSLKIFVKSLKKLCKRFDLKKFKKLFEMDLKKKKKKGKQTYLTPNPTRGPPSFLFFFSPPRPSSPLPAQ
jgi:hypothetical protein